MTIKERILVFLDKNNINKANFFEEMGISPSSFRGKALTENSIDSKKIVSILTSYTDLSSEWLLLGVGDMTKTKKIDDVDVDFTENTEIENPPIIPTALSRRQNVDILEVVQESTDGMEICPVRVDDLPISVWHRVRDNSLEPELRKDDKIALHAYPLGEEDPMPGLLYGINTRTNGMILRRLYPHPDGYIGRSYNREDFPDVVIPYNNIIRIYRALLQVRTL